MAYATIKRDFLNIFDEVFGFLPKELPPCTLGNNNQCSTCQICVNIQDYIDNIIRDPITGLQIHTGNGFHIPELTTPEKENFNWSDMP